MSHYISDKTIEDLWYTRDNKVSSLRQGGMSHEEFMKTKEDLLALTHLIASGCTQEVFERAHQRLKLLKEEGKLKKYYRALCNRVFSAFYPSRITSLIKDGFFFAYTTTAIIAFSLGFPKMMTGRQSTGLTLINA